MKTKLFLKVFFLIIIFSSCSTEDNLNASQEDFIVGTWGIYEYLEEDGRIRAVNSRSSENQMTFYSDGTATSERILDNIGTWENKGNETYSLTVEDEVIFFEILENEILKTEYGNGEASFFEKILE